MSYVVGAVCDSCGAESPAQPGSDALPVGFHQIEASKLDDRISFVVCAKCLTAWMATFKTMPHWSALGEPDPPRRVIHSETGEVMWLTAMGWLLDAFGREAPREPWRYDDPGAELFPPTGIYGHYKGQSYQVIDYAFAVSPKEPFVIYRALYGDSIVYARPARMWAEHVERDGYSGPRFVLVEKVGEP